MLEDRFTPPEELKKLREQIRDAVEQKFRNPEKEKERIKKLQNIERERNKGLPKDTDWRVEIA